MRMPNWCRSKYVAIPALVVWVIALIWVDRLFPQRPVARNGIEVLLSGAFLAYMVWLEGWRTFLGERVPYIVMMYAVMTITGRVGFRDHTLSGNFYSLLVVIAAGILYVVFLSLIGALPKGDPPIAQSLAEICAILRAFFANWPSWAQVRAEVRAERLVPRIRLVWVQSADLAGVVEYDSMHFAGMRVEECSDDWV